MINIIRKFIPQHHPAVPLGTCYLKMPLLKDKRKKENAPLIISLSNMLVLPERVPLKALKGFEGIWLQNQFHI